MIFTPFYSVYTGRRLHIFVLLIFSQVFPRSIYYYRIKRIDQSSEYTEPAYPLYIYIYIKVIDV